KLCGHAWFEKPPLLYWTAAAGMKLLGVGAPGVRLGTALAGALAPLALFAFARRPLGDRAAFGAALALLASVGFAGLARLAFTDMLLLLWFVVCLGALHRAFEARERSAAWLALACFAAGLAMLTKGAIGVVFPGAAALLELGFRRRLRDALRPSWLALGLPIAVGVGCSWYLALGLTQPGGFGFMRALFLEHHVGRFSQPMQGHGGSIFYYLPVLLLGLFPWSPLLPVALARADLRAGDERARFLRLFALFSAIAVVFFSVAATKLANYALPAFPGLALAVGALLARPREARDRALSVSWGVTLGFVAALSLGAALLPLAHLQLPALLGENAARHPALARPLELGVGSVVAAAALAAGAVLAGLAWRARRPERALAALACGAIAFYSVLFQTVLPGVDAQIGAPLRRIALRAATLTRPDEEVLLLGLRHRPSVCFYGERPTHYASGARWAQAEIFGGPGARIGITGDPQLAQFPGSARLEVLERDGGYVLFRAPAAGAATTGP
ncbi:MAG TPA: glycosyltransferase family 39 protein, partial [Myxococcota bacterium]|nr:glycosyltransferase family 39 protein [Myxococcota bacterium]